MCLFGMKWLQNQTKHKLCLQLRFYLAEKYCKGIFSRLVWKLIFLAILTGFRTTWETRLWALLMRGLIEKGRTTLHVGSTTTTTTTGPRACLLDWIRRKKLEYQKNASILISLLPDPLRHVECQPYASATMDAAYEPTAHPYGGRYSPGVWAMRNSFLKSLLVKYLATAMRKVTHTERRHLSLFELLGVAHNHTVNLEPELWEQQLSFIHQEQSRGHMRKQTTCTQLISLTNMLFPKKEAKHVSLGT